MNDDEIRIELTGLLGGIGLGPDQPEDDQNLHDLGLDSLDVVELSMDIEEEFDIQLTAEEVEGVETFGDLVELVARVLREETHDGQ